VNIIKRKKLIVLSIIVLVAMLLTAGCMAHAEVTSSAGKSGNQAAANIIGRTPSGDHSTGNDSGATSYKKITCGNKTTIERKTGRPARDD